MTAVMIVATGLLGTIFFASLVALIIICKHKHCRKMDFEEMAKNSSKCRKDVELVGAWSGLEMFVNYFPEEDEETFLDTGWAYDVESLIPYCVSLLKTCHQLTDSLVAKTMEKSTNEMKAAGMMEIIETARSISPRVDDVVKYMYPPLDSHQIESRSTALYMSVSHLVQISKKLSGSKESFSWADELLESMDSDIQTMRQIVTNIQQQSQADTLSEVSSRSSQSMDPMIIPKQEPNELKEA